MEKLSSKQLTHLGDSFLALAQAVGDYRMAHRTLISKSQNQQLRDLHWTLLNYADDFYAASAQVVVDEVTDTLEAIQKISVQINRSLKKLEKVQQAIEVAAAAVTLGAALFSKHPQAVNDAFTGLRKAWKQEEK